MKLSKSMRYKITLQESSRNYKAVVYRDFPESEEPKNTTITQRQIMSIHNVFTKLDDELNGQYVFRVAEIEQLPQEPPVIPIKVPTPK